jgi:hypothetical protein
MGRETQLLKLTLLGASVLLFAWSLSFDAYYTDGRPDGAPALLTLLTGWLGVTIGGFSWLANPLLGAAWLCLLLKRDVRAAFAAGAATILASAFFFQSSIVVDEAGTVGRISGVGRGYWLWLASMAIALAAACVPPMRSAVARGPRGERDHAWR